ncbi:hypothetical protein EON65_19990 [archaeon]|nr:MAG: hypothetical protein EON65_19990 [archaeon]
MTELVNRPIVPTYVEETKVFKIYYHTAMRISSILHIMKLKSIRLAVLDIIRRAENMVGPRNFVYSHFEEAQKDIKIDRQQCSGPEAKGAWMIRQDIFEYLLSLIASAKVVQRNVRTFILRKKFVIYMTNRIHATGILQRNMRRFLAYRKAGWLRRQLYSVWEQLWDNRYHRLYYYNIDTHYSQYDEPPDRVYRPLIREKHSAALMQAWPHLRDAATQANAPVLSAMEAANASKYLLCNICNQRACVKYCLDCHQEGESQQILHEDTKEYMVSRPVTYCLPCFVHEHPESNEEKAKHRSHVFEDAASPTAVSIGFDAVDRLYLKCCMCGESAIRKCQGPLDDEQIDLICRQLQRTPIDQWKRVLQDENVGGERKVMSILDQIMTEETPKESLSPSALLVAPNQLNAMRAALERLRSECDESYCKSCYKQVHSGGKRIHHRWVSFQERAPVCVVCTSTPAVFNCIECSTDYCDGCFKVFHNMGKKRRHKKEVIKEELERNQSYCFICTRRAADKCAFDRCNKMVCECCFEFKHKGKCSFNMLATPLIGSRSHSPSPSRRSISSPQTDVFSKKETKCVVCGEEADKRCVQCGDLYCSIVYMGNAGCFAKFHSKGNRASHTTESVVEMQLNSVRMSLKQKFAQEKIIKHKLGY